MVGLNTNHQRMEGLRMKLIDAFSHDFILQLAGIALLCLLSGCSKAGDEKAVGSAKAFTLKDWLCTITPSQCHPTELQKLFKAPPDAMYETTLGGKQLRIPMGFVDPIELIPKDGDLRLKKLYLTAFDKDMVPRSRENITEFIRNGAHPGLVRFNVIAGDRGRLVTPPTVEAFVQKEKARRIQDFEAVKRYPDKHGLEHWGNDYERARWVKPCELPGEMQQCGMRSQNDFYMPLKANGFQSYMECESWLALKASSAEKELTMTQQQRDFYFESGQYAKERAASPWRMSIDPHCRHHMHHAGLPGGVVLHYHLALLPHWKQIEERTRAILDAALSAQSVAR